MNANREALKAVLLTRRKNMSKSRRRRPAKAVSWLYPWATERRYGTTIKAWLRPLRDYVKAYLKANEEAILQGDSADQVREERKDAVPGGSFRRMIGSLNGWLDLYMPALNEGGKLNSPPVIYAGLGKIADTMNKFNAKQWDKTAKENLGVEFQVYEDWWPDVKDVWARENYRMITSSGRDYVHKINQRVETAITNGWSVGQLTEAIMKISRKIEVADAARLARDQIGKLNGQVTQARMEAVGLDLYLWSTSGDERVRGDPTGIYPNARPSHYEMDGKICRWDDPAVYSEDGGKHWLPRHSDWVQLHPGYDYNCRCTALSYWNELINEVDAQIGSDM
jgi:uncharacterized protein with gpF-like domain